MIAQKTKRLGGRLVDRGHVADLIHNYKQTRWQANSERLGKADSLSASFDLDALSDFLELARKQEADGIKVYFGAYPDFFSENPEYSGRQTVVLVATREKLNAAGKIVNKDIYYPANGKPE